MHVQIKIQVIDNYSITKNVFFFRDKKKLKN